MWEERTQKRDYTHCVQNPMLELEKKVPQ